VFGGGGVWFFDEFFDCEGGWCVGDGEFFFCVDVVEFGGWLVGFDVYGD